MNTKAIATISIIAFSALLSGCQTTRHETANWEYKVYQENSNEHFLEESLNKQGAEGWELVSSTLLRESGMARVIFKRKK